MQAFDIRLRSLAHFYIATRYLEMDEVSWTYSTLRYMQYMLRLILSQQTNGFDVLLNLSIILINYYSLTLK